MGLLLFADGAIVRTAISLFDRCYWDDAARNPAIRRTRL
jgi:hypothetical protein